MRASLAGAPTARKLSLVGRGDPAPFRRRSGQSRPARGGARARLRRAGSHPACRRLPQPGRRGARLRVRVAAGAPSRGRSRRGDVRASTAAGSERKTTGSYYTPTSLIVELLDSALDPVLDRAAEAKDPEQSDPRAHRVRSGVRVGALPDRRGPPDRDASRRSADGRSGGPTRGRARRAARRREPLHLRRRSQPDGG